MRPLFVSRTWNPEVQTNTEFGAATTVVQKRWRRWQHHVCTLFWMPEYTVSVWLLPEKRFWHESVCVQVQNDGVDWVDSCSKILVPTQFAVKAVLFGDFPDTETCLALFQLHWTGIQMSHVAFFIFPDNKQHYQSKQNYAALKLQTFQ